MKSERHFSSGGVIFRETSRGTKIALISRQGGEIWCLPKGHIDQGESSEQAALREVREETGLTGRILRKVGDIRYWFVVKEEKRKIFKEVSFFLVQHTGGNTKNHDFEVDKVRWFSMDHALSCLTYPSERKIVRKVRQVLKKQ